MKSGSLPHIDAYSGEPFRERALPRSSSRRLRLGVVTIGWLLLAGCATYRAQPLPARTSSPSTIAALHDGNRVTMPLRMIDIDQLVLSNNPDLLAARDQYGVAQAQMRQAGLLPNPSLNGGLGYLLSGPGDSTAWTAGISQDITALITLAPRRQAARAEAAQVNASLLWQEWQTLAKARLLVIDMVQGQRQIDTLTQMQSLLDTRSQRLQQSVHAGTSDMAAAAPYLSAAGDAQTTLHELQRAQLAQHHELASMLGLTPDADIPLDTHLDLPVVNDQRLHADAQSIVTRRPDLAALQLGYAAQEANLRTEVLAQFPALSIGYAAAQDNSHIRSGGPTITLDLPIFDRNQGNIAIAKATRQQLFDEYLARLNASRNEIDALLVENAQTRAQLVAIQPQLGEATRLATQSANAFKSGDIDLRAFVDLDVNARTRQAAAIALEQTYDEQRIALATLAGVGLPASLLQDPIKP